MLGTVWAPTVGTEVHKSFLIMKTFKAGFWKIKVCVQAMEEDSKNTMRMKRWVVSRSKRLAVFWHRPWQWHNYFSLHLATYSHGPLIWPHFLEGVFLGGIRREEAPSYCCCWEFLIAHWKAIWHMSENFKYTYLLTSNSTIVTRKEIKATVYKDICTQVFIGFCFVLEKKLGNKLTALCWIEGCPKCVMWVTKM